MLTQIELGQANPSLVTVDKVARALGTDFASLALTRHPAAVSISPAGAARTVWNSPAGSSASLHQSTELRPAAELWEWILVAGDRYQARPDPTGSQELYFVLTGVLVIEVDEHPLSVIPAGASATLRSDRNYAYRNAGGTSVRFVKVVQLAS